MGAFSNPMSIVIFGIVFFGFQLFVFSGLVMMIGFGMTSPPTWSGSIWDVGFFIGAWLLWAFSGIGQFIGVFASLMTTSYLLPVTLVDTIVAIFIFVAIVFYIRGTD